MFTDIDTWHTAMRKLQDSKPLGSGPHTPIPVDLNLEKVDAFARATPKHETTTIQKLAAYLTEPFKHDEIAAIRSIFCWVATNIRYDWDGFLSGHLPRQDAESVLRTRVSVCAGYSNLFYELCQNAAIKITAFKIIGAAMGVGLEAGDPAVNLDAHEWNAVLVHGEYRFIESTWASGTVTNGKFINHYNPEPYFLVSPTLFIYSHIPKSDPKEQFLSIPLTHKEWIELPHIGAAFRTNGMRLVRATGHLSQNAMCLLSFLHITDDYLEIVVEVDNKRFSATGGLLLGHLTPGRLENIRSPAGRTVVWVDTPPHSTSLHDCGGLAIPMMTHSQKHSTNPQRTLHFLRAYIPHGDFVCKVMASITPTMNTCFPALTFRVSNSGRGNTATPPTIFAGSVKPVHPLSGTLRVGEVVKFQVQATFPDHTDVIVFAPDKTITKMKPENGFWVVSVRINQAGEWRVGHQTGLKLGFGASYKAV
ncbi:hypothetical protein HDU83_001009 [Entophlyctis luteolus]|nr:hypothetical protein HDU82_006752 [Entophlyctis luteolus]KAJ3348807.1 hypothetical protein HDU83_001009 [Entophlyctis luteolus]